MAVKTITIDMAAYEALSRRERAGQSFSDVIKEQFAAGGGASDLLTAAGPAAVIHLDRRGVVLALDPVREAGTTER